MSLSSLERGPDFSIDIAGVCCRVTLDKDLPGIERIYRGFFSSPVSPDFTVRVTLEDEVPAAEEVEISCLDNGESLKGRGMNITVSQGEISGEVFRDIHALDSVLRAAYSVFLPPRGGLLMHASSLGGEVYTGPSGSGKTSSVRGRDNILSDDITALRKVSGSWRVCSTPFSGEFAGEFENRSCPLTGFNMLRLDGDLEPGRVYREILRNTLFYSASPEGFGALADIARELSLLIPGRGVYSRALAGV